MTVDRTLDDTRLLADVARAVAWSPDAGTTARQVTALLVPRVADWCIVDLREGEVAYRRHVVVHVDPHRQARATLLLGTWILDARRGGMLDVLRTGQRQVVTAGAEPGALLPRDDPDCERLVLDLGLAGYVAVPLRAQARTLGVLTVVAAGPARRFDDGALALVETVARLTALAIPGSRLETVAPPPGRRDDDLLAALSHQLRTPLTAMLAWLHLVRQGGDPAEVARAVDTIERNGRTLGRLVDELLDTAVVLTGALSLAWRPVDLVVVVERALATLAAAAGDKGVRLDAQLELDAGACAGDPARLEQVATVLVGNALRSTPRGGRVVVRVDADGPHARLRVSDGGPGIAAADLPYVFGLFRRDAHEPGGEGLGLELALARGLVELHGGRVEATSAGPGHGTTFTVLLPRSPQPPRGV